MYECVYSRVRACARARVHAFMRHEEMVCHGEIGVGKGGESPRSRSSDGGGGGGGDTVSV